MITRQVNVNSTQWTAIAPTFNCLDIEVYETNQAGTTDYYVVAPTSSNTPTTKPAGSKFEFKFPSRAHEFASVFFLKTVTGSVTFDVVEQ